MTPNDRSRLFRSRASQALQASAQALDARAGAELLRIAEAWHALAIQAERGSIPVIELDWKERKAVDWTA